MLWSPESCSTELRRIIEWSRMECVTDASCYFKPMTPHYLHALQGPQAEASVSIKIIAPRRETVYDQYIQYSERCKARLDVLELGLHVVDNHPRCSTARHSTCSYRVCTVPWILYECSVARTALVYCTTVPNNNGINVLYKSGLQTALFYGDKFERVSLARRVPSCRLTDTRLAVKSRDGSTTPDVGPTRQPHLPLIRQPIHVYTLWWCLYDCVVSKGSVSRSSYLFHRLLACKTELYNVSLHYLTIGTTAVRLIRSPVRFAGAALLQSSMVTLDDELSVHLLKWCYHISITRNCITCILWTNYVIQWHQYDKPFVGWKINIAKFHSQSRHSVTHACR